MEQRFAAPRTTRKSRFTLILLWLLIVGIVYLLISYVAQQEIARQTAQWEQKLQILRHQPGPRRLRLGRPAAGIPDESG